MLALMLALAFTVPAMAFDNLVYDGTNTSTAVFSGQTATGTSAIYSPAVHLGKTTGGTVLFYGYSTAALAKSGGTMNGTAIFQCGATSTGPWVTGKDSLANALSTTSNAVFRLDTYCNWFRAGWTPTAISPNRAISVYLLGIN
jgi:hypothetical protein